MRVKVFASLGARLLVVPAVLLCIFAAPVAAAAVEAKPFGIAKFTMQITRTKQVPYGPGIPGPGFVNEPYTFTQAGGHPDGFTSTLEFASEEVGSGHSVVPTRDPKDMVIGLPLGLSANPMAVPRCPLGQVLSGGSCPVDSQVGVFVMHVFGNKAALGPIVDLVPEAGQSAELGLESGAGTLLMTGRLVRTVHGYGVRVVARGLPMLAVVSAETTLWGVPAAAEHDAERGLSCAAIEVNQQWGCEGGGVSSGVSPVPFLTMPTDCSAGPQAGTAWADSWEEPGQYLQAQSTLPGVTGCNLLPFSPELEVRPETLLADEPVGLSVNIENKQTESAQTAATPPLRDATVTLPPGVSISPAVADGIQACNQAGPEGIDMPTGVNANGEPLKPEEIGEGEEVAPSGEGRLAPGHCPEASTVGTAEALTPLLPMPIKGRVYLAAPGCGGPGQPSCTQSDAVDGNLYRMYVELGGDSGHRSEGVNIKIEGKVEANTATGQLTVKLTENPQLPLSQLTIHLNGGPRALLDNPATCGSARTTSDLEPWSASGITPPPENLLMPGTPDSDPSYFYDVTGCASPAALHPGLLAGTLIPQAGAFSEFTLTVTRSDHEQYLSGLQMHTPPGLAAMLSSVPLCPQAAASEGTCPEASRIGKSLVTLGAGSHPFAMSGIMYLTGGYEGAPFGLSIVTNAVAGPLNLGLIVIRARIDVDPETSALTITSRSLPQIVFGVPLRMQQVTLDIDRPNFIFNPTNCTEQQITATVAGNEGARASLSNRFAIGGCRNLVFKPKLTATVTAHAGDRDGASLDIKLKRPNLPMGAEANLAGMRVALPEQLPVRLTALRNSCPQPTFNANPAGCPSGSVVGIARASTPVLPVQMAGPLYFVAHGRDHFPSPVLVLQGDGVRLNLVGETKIDTSGTVGVFFPAIPDVPLSSFEMYLPRGPHSMLDATTNLCARVAGQKPARRNAGRAGMPATGARASLTMPTELIGQNGAVIHQQAKVTITGCPNGRAARHPTATRHR
jgi:hypothetical protein